MNGYIETLLRSVLTFIGLLFLALIMGRKQLSQITFFDYVVGITIGSIASVLAVDRSIGIMDGIIAMLVWSVMPIMVGYIAMKSIKFRRLVDGEPRIVIQNGLILNKNMLKEKYNIGDLLMQLRDKGIFDIAEVDFAILEPNGKLSVLKKTPFHPVTLNDMDMASGYKGVMIEFVIDGKMIMENIKSAGKNAQWLYDQLNHRHIGSIKDVIFAGYQQDGQLFISLRNDLSGIHLV